VVIILENWSYDSLYAQFDGGDGLANAMQAPPQTDVDGAVYSTLPQTEGHLSPAVLPNAPFDLDPYLGPQEVTTLDNTNNFYVEQQQILDLAGQHAALDRSADRHHFIGRQHQIGGPGDDARTGDVGGVRRQPDVAQDRAALLRQPRHVQDHAGLALDMRGHAEQRADGQHAGAADAGVFQFGGAGWIPVVGDWNGSGDRKSDD